MQVERQGDCGERRAKRKERVSKGLRVGWVHVHVEHQGCATAECGKDPFEEGPAGKRTLAKTNPQHTTQCAARVHTPTCTHAIVEQHGVGKGHKVVGHLHTIKEAILVTSYAAANPQEARGQSWCSTPVSYWSTVTGLPAEDAALRHATGASRRQPNVAPQGTGSNSHQLCKCGCSSLPAVPSPKQLATTPASHISSLPAPPGGPGARP